MYVVACSCYYYVVGFLHVPVGILMLKHATDRP